MKARLMTDQEVHPTNVLTMHPDYRICYEFYKKSRIPESIFRNKYAVLGYNNRRIVTVEFRCDVRIPSLKIWFYSW